MILDAKLLPPGYEMIRDEDSSRVVLCLYGTPLPVLFHVHDYPVVVDAEDAAVAFALQCEGGAHPWRLSRSDQSELPVKCAQAVQWQREMMSHLVKVAQFNPIMHGAVGELMLRAALDGQLAAYRAAFDALVPHTIDADAVEQHLLDAQPNRRRLEFSPEVIEAARTTIIAMERDRCRIPILKGQPVRFFPSVRGPGYENTAWIALQDEVDGRVMVGPYSKETPTFQEVQTVKTAQIERVPFNADLHADFVDYSIDPYVVVGENADGSPRYDRGELTADNHEVIYQDTEAPHPDAREQRIAATKVAFWTLWGRLPDGRVSELQDYPTQAQAEVARTEFRLAIAHENRQKAIRFAKGEDVWFQVPDVGADRGCQVLFKPNSLPNWPMPIGVFVNTRTPSEADKRRADKCEVGVTYPLEMLATGDPSNGLSMPLGNIGPARLRPLCEFALLLQQTLRETRQVANPMPPLLVPRSANPQRKL